MIGKWVWYLDAPIDRSVLGVNRKSPQMHLQPSFSPRGNLNHDDGQRHVKVIWIMNKTLIGRELDMKDEAQSN